MVLFFVELQN